MSSMFQSLRSYNYRLWAGGALVSNIGTWMQRIGQDWLVLTVLTHHNATAVGTVMALQFGPPLLLLPLSGFAADHVDRRKLLLFTQGAAGLLALGLGLLTVMGVVQLWQVYGFALLLGCVTAFDAPTRQAFVSDLVTDHDLANAVALNSTSFNGARMIGPAVAGVLIAAGSGAIALRAAPDRALGIVVAAEPARIAPFAAAETAFAPRPGEHVEIEQTREQFLYVRAGAERAGWMPRNAVETVIPTDRAAPHT